MRVLILSGGYHDFFRTTPLLKNHLGVSGHHVDATEDASVLLSSDIRSYDVLVFNTRRASVEKHIVDIWKRRGVKTEVPPLTEDEQSALKRFVAGGKGFISIHVSSSQLDGFPDFHELTGGGWVPGVSSHPPLGEFAVTVSNPGHPCAAGIADFRIRDELYYDVAQKPGNDVFLSANYAGQPQPMAWTRLYGRGKVLNIMLGHELESCQVSEFKHLIVNGVNWSSTDT